MVPDPLAQALELLGKALAQRAAAPAAAAHTVTVTAALGFTAERFAAAPDATRIGADELATALGRSRASVYQLVKRAGLPCRKGPTGLTFVVGDVKRWIAEREAPVNAFVPRIAARRRA